MSAGVSLTGELSVNGERHTCMLPITVAAALSAWGYEATQVAVAVNGEFVPRSIHAQRLLQAGDAVDVLSAVQGG